MKVLFLLILLCSFGITSTAFGNSVVAEDPGAATSQQDQEAGQSAEPENRNYFPQAGDFGIGFDGTPFLNYVGNMFNGSTNNTLNLGDNTLHFRYFITDQSAIRVALSVLSIREVDKFYLDDQADQVSDPLSRAQVEDERVTHTNEYQIKAGYLMFRGENRLRGFFGGDVFLGFGRDRIYYDYGNRMTEANPAPESVVDWNNGNTANMGMRPLEETDGAVYSVGLGAVVGAEYYMMPKVGVGAEMGLVYGHAFMRQGYTTSETFVGSRHVEEDFEVSPEFTERMATTSFPCTFGNLYLMIHF